MKAAKEAEIKLMDMNMESFHEIYKLKVAAAAK